MIGISSVFTLIHKVIANQTYTDISDTPDGRLLQVSSSRLSQDDISAEYEHSTFATELTFTDISSVLLLYMVSEPPLPRHGKLEETKHVVPKDHWSIGSVMMTCCPMSFPPPTYSPSLGTRITTRMRLSYVYRMWPIFS